MTIDLHEVFDLAARTSAAPTFDVHDVVRTGRRRRQRNRYRWGVVVTVFAVMAVSSGLVIRAHGLDASKTGIPVVAQVPNGVIIEHSAPRQVMTALAEAQARGTVTWPVQWVVTTTGALGSLSPYSPPEHPETRVYYVQVQGSFTFTTGLGIQHSFQSEWPSPPQVLASASHVMVLRGTVMGIVVKLTEDVSVSRLANKTADLGMVGDVHYYAP